VSSVRIVYIRHGESEWNDVFNKGLGPVRPQATINVL
jgi:broad specificity phosphatase PhoE